MKKYFAFFICFFMLFGIQTAPAFAESIGGVTASIDGSRLVAVSGTVAGGAGRLVSIRITDPEGHVEYAGSTVSAAYGSFAVSYTMANAAPGRYNVSVSALGVSAPVSAYFEYGTDNSLSALALSQGALDKVFSPDATQYSVTVDNRVNTLTVTPTAADATAVVKVNNNLVSSGSPSSPVSLNTGTNTVKVDVTALNGKVKTYTILVTRQNSLSAALTASASIGADRKVLVSGTVSSGAGQLVTVRITSPNGGTEYAGAVTSGSGGNYQLSYSLSNPAMGRYTVSAGSLGVASPASAYFDYGNDTGLSNLSISSGTLNPAFSPDGVSYSVDVGGDIDAITITSTAHDAKAKIEVNDWVVASGYPSRSIPLREGANAIKVDVTAQDGTTTRTYTIMVYKPAPMPAGVTVNAQMSREKLVTISGAITSKAPQVTVMVIDPDGRPEYVNTSATGTGGSFSLSYPMANTAKGRYYVSVGALGLSSPALTYFVYDPSNADLKNLAISDGTLAPAFVPSDTGYSASVGYGTGSVTVTPTTSDPYASVAVNGASVASGSPSGYVSLNVGNNTVSVVVTAQDGTLKTYTVTVHRDDAPPPPPQNLSNNSYLDNLFLSNQLQLDTAFVWFTTDYTAHVANGVSQIQVIPITQENHATVTVNGKPVASGDSSDAIDLNVGDNTITIVVTAQDASTRTYTLVVTRAVQVN